MPSPIVSLVFILLTTIPSTYYIYNYPRLHNCTWPDPDAPFRLLALADPQIEGDKKQRSWRGRIDIWGNDRYLRHVHRESLNQIRPEATHEVVLGDLFGSQWIKDEEFVDRVRRYNDIIFQDKLQGTLYGVDRFMNITGNHDIGYAGELNPDRLGRWEQYFGPANYIHTLEIPNLPPLRVVLFNTLNLDSPATDLDMQYNTFSFLESLLPDDDTPIPQTVLLTHLPLYRGPGICSDPPRFDYWNLNITDHEGNVTGFFQPLKHQNHLSRWASDWILETIFGDEDEGIILDGHDHEGCDVLHRRLPESEHPHTYEIVHDELRRREVEDMDPTHVNADVTLDVDPTNLDPEVAEDIELAAAENFNQIHTETEIIRQPHPLEVSQQIAHIRNNISHGIWKAQKFTPSISGIREITVRSMMGDFQGNVGLLAASYNNDKQLWEFQYSSCSFVVQHWWWVVHVWDCICIVWVIGYITHPLWWIHWETKGRPMLEKGLDRASVAVERQLESWGLISRGRRRQDTEDGGRKRRE